MMMDHSVAAIISSNRFMASFEKKAFNHRAPKHSNDNGNFEDALKRAYNLPKSRF